MSAEATGWVYRYSPFKGTTFQIHHAIADSVNDQHGYELWMRQGVLATKTRTTRKTVNTALETIVQAGLLRLLEAGKGGANRYLFLMPDGMPVVYESRPKGVTTGDTPTPEPLTEVVTSGDRGVTPGDRGGVTRGYTEPKGKTQREDQDRLSTTGTRCPDPFFITDAMREWAEREDITVDLREHTRRFVDYWRAVPGAKGRKVDWPATWRNWIRREQDNRSKSRASTATPVVRYEEPTAQ